MIPKVQEKDLVIKLRKKGYTYNQILEVVPVSKSSVSLWLKDSVLTEAEMSVLKRRKNTNISRGRIRAAASLRRARESRDKKIFDEAKREFSAHVRNPFFQLGIALYWAEGAKRSSAFGFTNSDREMLMVMIHWMREFLGCSEEEIRLRVFTHKSFAHERHEEVWSRWLEIPLERFGKTVYKSQGLMVKKRPNYTGCVRVELGKVRYFRKISYWQRMLIEHYGKQEYCSRMRS